MSFSTSCLASPVSILTLTDLFSMKYGNWICTQVLEGFKLTESKHFMVRVKVASDFIRLQGPMSIFFIQMWNFGWLRKQSVFCVFVYFCLVTKNGVKSLADLWLQFITVKHETLSRDIGALRPIFQVNLTKWSNISSKHHIFMLCMWNS